MHAQVCVLAPEMGPLAAVIVAPEGGSWVLDEVNVSSSRTNHTDRCAGATRGRGPARGGGALRAQTLPGRGERP